MAQDCMFYELGDFTLSSGQVLRDARLGYQTYGTLAPDGDNVIVMPTFYTGTHARNEGFFGAGRAIDPTRHFIVSVNLFGNGLSSSPSNINGAQSGAGFPLISFQDNVRCQHRLLTEQLGVERIALVVGWSMAGCQACLSGLNWRARTTSPRTTASSAAATIQIVIFSIFKGVRSVVCNNDMQGCHSVRRTL